MAAGSWITGWPVSSKVLSAEYKKSMGAVYDSTLLADAASFDISSSYIPVWGAHLLIELHLRSKQAADTDTACLRFNGDTGSNYYSQLQRAAATTATLSETGAVNLAHVGFVPGNNAAGGHKGGYQVVIPNFRNTADNKVGTSNGGCFDSATTGHLTTEHRTFVWDDAGVAITAVTVLLASGANIASGSRATVYVMGV